MKMLKKLLITALALSLFATLAGCGDTTVNENVADYEKIENEFTQSFEGTLGEVEITDDLKFLANDYAYSIALSSILYNGDLKTYVDGSNGIYGLPIGNILQQIVSAPAYNDDDSMSAEEVRAAMLDLYATENEPTFTDQEFNTLLTFEDGIYTLFDGDVAAIYEDLGYYYDQPMALEKCYYNLTEATWSEYEDDVLVARFDVYDITNSEVTTAVGDQNFEALNFITPEKIMVVNFKFDFENGQTQISNCGYSGADPLDYIVPIEIGLAEKDFVAAVLAGNDQQIVNQFNTFARENMFLYVPDYESYEVLVANDYELGLTQLQVLLAKHYQNRYMNHPEIESILTADEMQYAIHNLYYAEEYTNFEPASYLREVIYENGEYSLMPGGVPYYSNIFYVLNDYDYTDDVFSGKYDLYWFDEYNEDETALATSLNSNTLKPEYFTNVKANSNFIIKLSINEDTGQAQIMTHHEINEL